MADTKGEKYQEEVIDGTSTLRYSVHEEYDTEKSAYAVDANDAAPLDEKEERRLVRKLDWIYVMPFVAMLNFLQFFDKSALNYSSVLNLKEDTHITDQQYSWLGSIFYLGYILYQGPNMVLLQRVSITKYMATLIILWGLVLTVTSEAKNFSQLAALRFLLGFFEAGIYPSCIMLLSTLYRRREQTSRLGVVYFITGVSLSFGSLIGYGIGQMDNVGGKSPWQWIMIILGAITMFFGIICFLFLVDNPRSRFLRLTPEQERIVEDRLRDNAVVRTESTNWDHVFEALCEPRFYCFFFTSLLVNLQNGVMNTFSSLITKGFGFSSLNAILLGIPSGVVDCIIIVIAVWYNRKYGQTFYVACCCLVVAIIGLILLVVIPKPQVKLVGLYLSWSYCAAYTMLLVALANNVSGYTKKIFYSCGLIVGYTIGNFVGPLMMVSWQAPLYLGGMIACMAANAISICLLLIARYTMARINKQRLANGVPAAVNKGKDITDKEDTTFIYRL